MLPPGGVGTFRLCLDANTAVAGLVSPRGVARIIIRSIEAGSIRLVVSEPICIEYQETAVKPGVLRLLSRHGVPVAAYVQAMRDLLAYAEFISPVGVVPACRDEDDRKYLHCAVAGNVDFLVSMDRDLLDMKAIGRVPIGEPAALLHALEAIGWTRNV